MNGSGRVSGVEVEGNVELLNSRPEDIPFRAIIEDHVVAIRTSSLSVVDKSALEAVLLDDSLQLCRCLVGIVHG